MDRIALETKLRPVGATKSELSNLRSSDRVPAVVYGRGKDTIHVLLEGRTLRQALSSGSNAIIELEVDGEEGSATETVMFKDIQRNILFSDRILHVDFIRISLTEKRLVDVPLQVEGDAPGVKEGGVLQILLREIEIYCLPTAIPDVLEIDISSLNIGESLTAKDIQLPEEVELKTDPEETVVLIASPAEVEEVEGEEEAAEGEEEEAEEDSESEDSAGSAE